MTDQDPVSTPSRSRPPLTPRVVGYLGLAALIVPAVALLCWIVGMLTAGPGGELAGFGPYFCRRGHCVGQPNAVIETSVRVLLEAIPYALGVCGLGFLLALLTRRRGFLTIPANLIYIVMVLIVSVNTAAYSLSGGNQVAGVIVIGVFAIGVPILVVWTARAAIPAGRPAALVPGLPG